MNSKILLRIAAVAAVALAPLAAWAQVNSDAGEAASAEQQGTYKYEVYLGGAYSRIRQVPVTYSGLLGGKAYLARDWGKYFQLIGSVDYYKLGTGHTLLPNPGHPSMYSVLVGPGIHMDLFAGISGQLFAELGAEHTGGEQMSPSTSVAGGFGGGLTYNFNPKWGLQLSADRLGASFPVPGPPQESNSTHRTWNARATIGLVYRF